MKKIRLVTFDVKGTLLTLHRPIGEIYADAAKHFGFRVDPQKLTSNFNKQIMNMSKNHPNFGLYSGLGWKKWWKNVVIESFESQAERSALSASHLQCLENLSNYLIERFTTEDEWKSVEGSVDLLNYLHSKNIHIGVISNFDPRLHKILEEKGIRKYFAFVLTSYEVGYSKPDINIFKNAEKTYLNAGYKIDKYSVVHIGDSFKLDYCGAKNAGWNAILIEAQPDKIIYDSEVLVFKNLTEIKEQYFKA